MATPKKDRNKLKWRFNFSTKTLIIIPIAVGINVIGGALASTLKLPVFLDMIGTILVACLAGPWIAALTGFITNIFLALVANPVFLPYAAVSILCGFVAGILAFRGAMKHILGVILLWLTITVVNTLTASIVTFFVFGGATGVNATSLLTASLVAATKEIFASVLTSAFIENLIDKGISTLIAYFIIRSIPPRFLSQYQHQFTQPLDDKDVIFDDELADAEDGHGI
ncbi:ECF transporter S component [Actinotignum urinale]|uniref:ECF transporter S component n=1 Tax=Actinotignum urinale TaxID=190146 RepID=A0AAW9HLI8_9ACTO|nr:ECF transporter S component [Actinotignum urinale]MDY5128958.1 hypothetical protein [Actinotignum urinale]MDY5132486.1 hypothetical protein [Actinotignum urinale]MDY5154758.1 hypothetical protein [Actinotignum urinale]